MHRIADDLGPLSLRLSRVLDDVGVNECMLMRRRRTYLTREKVGTIGFNMTGGNGTIYHFGSQTEASTTPGMGSDLDTLYWFTDVNVMRDWRDWVVGKINHLMIKDETTPPRHYKLQVIRSDTPEPVTLLDLMTIYDMTGRALLKRDCWKYEAKIRFAECGLPFINEGPSCSFSADHDFVYAEQCKQLPSECQTWLDRPRPGHWPTPDMLREARECGCFFLPIGHPDSENSIVEWRMSPSLIERILMFSMTLTQLKCYIVLKLIKVSIFKRIVGNHLTSFHCKTAFWYTVENSPSEIWQEQNLIKCVQRCLLTLLRFLDAGFCPHYIISNMNLFSGKLKGHERLKLREIISSKMLKTLDWVYSICVDQVDHRLVSLITAGNYIGDEFLYRLSGSGQLAISLTIEIIECVHKDCRAVLHYLTTTYQHPQHVLYQLSIRLYQLLTVTKNDGLFEHQAARFYIQQLSSHLATLQSSLCTFYSQSLTRLTLALFQFSMNTDVASSRLKFASVLYCRGQLHLAADVLQDVENRFGDDVQSVCGCGLKHPDAESKLVSSDVTLLSDQAIGMKCVALCVRFLKQEACCVPPILLCEMNRSVGDDFRYRNYAERQWMEWAVVDSRPYMYYLQYLTLGRLSRRPQQLVALGQLLNCFNPELVKDLYHGATDLNLLGHCWEMESRLDLAFECYNRSVECKPRNNAANCHILRLDSQFR